MTLIIGNDDVKRVLTTDLAIDSLEQAYRDLSIGEAVCRPRIDISIPTVDPAKTYRWGTMEGGSTRGYFAIRMKSDIMYKTEYEGVVTEEKYCTKPGVFCGLILLFDASNGEPLALINDGHLQHCRVGADSAIGTKYMARQDASVLGMVGSGGMARSHAETITKVRDIKRIQAYSPTKANRQAYAQEMSAKLGIEVVAVDDPRDVYRGADIVCGCTDSAGEVIIGDWLEPGTHVTCIGGKPDAKAMKRFEVGLRLGNATPPSGLPEFGLEDEHITYAARRQGQEPAPQKRGHGPLAGDRTVLLSELLNDPAKGRTSDDQITFSERGNIQGAQFFAVAGKVFEAARDEGLGREIPTEWLLQDIRN